MTIHKDGNLIQPPLLEVIASDKVGDGNVVDEVIKVRPERLTREELIRQLREYQCPEKILLQLEEWLFDYALDNLKLKAWRGEE
jgi:parvulin-like peptidyl-prolyl isomerase